MITGCEGCEGELLVADVFGRTVAQTPVRGNGTMTIDLKGFARGVYLVTLTTPQGSSSRRLTVTE